MKILRLLPLLALLALSACAHVTVERTANGTNTSLHATTFLSNTALKNLGLDTTTKTTSSLLKLSGATTEPNPEAITASGTALGDLIGTAAATAAKGVAKP